MVSLNVSRRFNNFTQCLTRLTTRLFDPKPTEYKQKTPPSLAGFVAPPAGLEPATL